MNAEELLSKIKEARWETVIRTFGNDHSTLIGVLVDWWISLDRSNHTALESGPTNGYAEKDKRGQRAMGKIVSSDLLFQWGY